MPSYEILVIFVHKLCLHDKVNSPIQQTLGTLTFNLYTHYYLYWVLITHMV